MKNLLKIEIWKFFASLQNLIFSIFFPFILMIILSFSLGSGYLRTGYVSIYILAASVPLIGVSINLCDDKINGILKSLFLIPKAFAKKLAVIFIVYLSGYFVSSILVTIGLTAILNTGISAAHIFFAFSMGIIIYIMCFASSVFLAKVFKQLYLIITMTTVLFYIMIFTAGLSFPFQATLDWYYYLTFWTPQGLMVYFLNHSVGFLIFDSPAVLGVAITIFIIFASVIGYLFWWSFKRFRYII